MVPARQQPARPEAEPDAAVAAWLRANPRFLADHPELYTILAPPHRIHGEALADHMQAMLARARAHAASLARCIAAGRASETLVGRVQLAVLALIATPDSATYVTEELPACLGMDAARLLPATQAAPLADTLGRRAVLVRRNPTDAATIYGEAAALACHDALIRLPSWGLLCLASRDTIDADAAKAALPFLGQSVAAALLR